MSCGSGFCVSMGTNRTEDYDAAVNPGAEGVRVISKWAELDRELERLGAAPVDSQPDSQSDFQPDFPEENAVKVEIPEHLDSSVIQAPLWKEYDSRCINCGRCNFVCPTCTCFTMQDIYYTDNGRAGERRRVHASCMTATPTWPGAAATGRPTGSGCALRCSTRFRISRNSSGIRCAWAADAATTSARNTYRFPPA